MCRNKSEGARRCACDTSEARRLRRRNASIIAGYTAGADALKESKPKTVVRPAENPVLTNMEKIKQKTVEIDQLKAILISSHDDALRDSEVTFSDGSVLKVENSMGTVLDAEGNLIDGPEHMVFLIPKIAELKTLDIGNDISNIVIDRMGGITPEEVAEEDTARIKIFDKEVDVIQKKLAASLAKREEEYPLVRDEKGVVTRTASNVFRAAVADGDEGAQKLVDEYGAIVEELNGKRIEAIELSSGQNSINGEYMTKYRQEVMNVLKEIRPMGGTVTVDDKSAKNAMVALNDALEVYPSAWVEATNDLPPMVVKNSSARAHYTSRALQDEFKVTPDYRSVIKPGDWEPDPTTRDGVGIWHKADARGRWTDTENDMSYEHSGAEPGEQVWIHQEVKWHHPYWANDNYDHEQKPRGNGWKKIYTPETKYNSVTQKMEETGRNIAQWYRPLRSRKNTSSAIKPELTIPTVMPRGASEEDKNNVMKAARNTAIHEFAHRVENSKKVGEYITKIEDAFITRRTTDPQTGNREKMVRVGAGAREKGYEDDFVAGYMGRMYATDRDNVAYREVLATGSEAVFGTKYGSLAGFGRRRKDPEMRNLILGLWASA